LELTFHREVKPTLDMDIFQILAPFFKNNRNFNIFHINNGSNQIKSLASMLSKCKGCPLQSIRLRENSASVGDTTSLLNSLSGMHNLGELELVDMAMGDLGCIALAKLLNKPASTIQALSLERNYLNDEGITILSKALTMANNLFSLYLIDNTEVSAFGWYSFSVALAHPMCMLEGLSLENTTIDDEGITKLGESLAVNSTMKYLILIANRFITATGWQGFSKFFRNRCSALEEINVADCGIDDEGAIAIAIALEGKPSLKRLTMTYNRGITAEGWTFVFHTLLPSVPSLEELEVFAGLDRYAPFDWTDQMDWTVLSRALCDSSSICRTYSSNHTFHSLDGDDDASSLIDGVPVEILSLLKLNRNETNKAEVARQKILKCHFAEGNTNIHKFSRMPLTSMPFAFEWIGRDKCELSLMFSVVRELPTLFHIMLDQGQHAKKQRCWSS
jgi:hypothetical protein